MKGLQKFFSLVVAVFCFCCLIGCWDGDGSVSSNPAGTGPAPISSTLPVVNGQPTGGFRVYIDFNEEVVFRAKINNDTEYQLMPFLKTRATSVEVWLYNNQNQYEEYGHVALPVVDGVCDTIVEGVLPGDYKANIYGVGLTGRYFTAGEISITIEANKYPKVPICFEIYEALTIPVKLIPTFGEFSPNFFYRYIVETQGFGAGGGSASYTNQGELSFVLLAYRPFLEKLVRILVNDNSGLPQAYDCPFEILDIVNLEEGEELELSLYSGPETGGIIPDITFEDEEVFKLSRSSEIFDGTAENPTGYAGDPNCLIGSFILQVDNDETVAGRFVCIFMTEIIQQYFKSVGYYINKMGQNDSEIISYQANLDSIKFVYGSASLPMFGEEFEPGFYQLKIRARIKEGVQTPEAFSIGVSCHAQGVDTGIYYSTQRVESQKIFIKNSSDLNGKLVRSEQWDEIYYVYNNIRYIIPANYPEYQEAIMDSWGWKQDDIIEISSEKMESMSLGYNVTLRPGTYLVKTSSDPKIYAVEYQDRLRHITEAALPLIYGDNWKERILVVPDVFFANYSISSEIIDARMETVPISTGILVPTDFPVGSIIDTTSAWIGDGGESGFLIGKISARKLTHEGIEANGFNRKFFINSFGFRKCVSENNPITAHLPELNFLSNYVNVDTIDDINGGLGENGQSVSYCWYNGLPRNVKVGDTLEFLYDDGSINRKSSAMVILHPEGWEHFCEVPWGMSLPNYTARQNYTIRVVH